MTGAETLLARTALGAAAAVATVLLPRFRPAYAWSERAFRRRYLTAFVSLRLLLFLLVFRVLHVAPRGDLPGIYISEIHSYLEGRVPYRNYPTSYAPLFPSLYASVYRLWPSPLTLILFSIAVEVLTALLFLKLMPRIISEPESRLAALLCVANPISLQFVTIDGQNNVLIGLFLALTLLWLTERRNVLSGAALGSAIVTVKFLPLLFTPVFPIFLRRRALAWIAACAAVVGCVYGYFQLVLQAPVLQAVQREGEIKSAGGLPFLVESLVGRDLGRFGWDALLLVVLLGILVFGWQVSRRTAVGSRSALAASTFLLPALLLAVMALGKKTWPTYTEMVLFPLAMMVAASEVGSDKGGVRRRPGNRAVLLLGGFSFLSVVAHSVWATLLGQAPAVEVHRLLRVGDAGAALLLLLEAALFGSYAALALLSLKRCRQLLPYRISV